MKNPIYKHDDEYYYDIIRTNLKRFRIKFNLTQQDLADLTGLSRQYICDIENKNRNKHLTIAILGRISDALSIPITDFFIENTQIEKQETVKFLVKN